MYQVIGLERLHYRSNKTGKEVLGWKVYYTYSLPDGVEHEGLGADSVFVSDALLLQSGVMVGSSSMPVFDKRGRCTGFMEVS